MSMKFFRSKTRHAARVSNLDELRFVGSYWMRRKYTFATACALTLVWTGLDLSLPVPSAHLIGVIASTTHGDHAAWQAWRLFVGLFAGYAIARNPPYPLRASISAPTIQSPNNY